MKILINLFYILVLFTAAGSAIAAECNTRDMPDELYKLIKDKKYNEAVKQAKAAYIKDRDNSEAAFVLARVYINSTLVSAINLNTGLLGFRPGESGKKEITAEMFKKATSSTFTVNQDYFRDTDEYIRSVVSRWPEARDFFYCLTKIYFYNADHKAFINTLHETAQLQKDNEQEAVDFLITYGTNLMHVNRFRRAEDVYSTLLKTFPGSVPLLSSRGVSVLKQGHTSRGAAYFDQAYRHNKKDVIVAGNIAEAAMLLRDFKKANRFLLRKSKLLPNRADVYFDLAINSMHAGPRRSKKYWKKYFKIHANHPDDEAWSKNAGVIQQAVDSDKTTLDDWHSLAVQMIQNRAPKYAIPVLHYVNLQKPHDASIVYSMAHAYDAGKNFDLQEKALFETLALLKHPDNQAEIDKDQIYYNLSRTAYALDKHDDALKHLEKIRDKQKLGASIDHMYGLIYEATGDKQKAERHYLYCTKKAKDPQTRDYCSASIK